MISVTYNNEREVVAVETPNGLKITKSPNAATKPMIRIRNTTELIMGENEFAILCEGVRKMMGWQDLRQQIL